MQTDLIVRLLAACKKELTKLQGDGHMASNTYLSIYNNRKNNLARRDTFSSLVDFFLNPFDDEFFREPVRCLSKDIVSNSYPPANIYAEKDGTYCAELAVAGYSRDEISVETENDVIKVVLGKEPDNPTSVSTSEETVTENGTTSKVVSKIVSDDDKRYFQKGIKKQYCTWEWDVTDFKLDLSTAQVSLDNGILKISAAQRESAKPKKLAIN